MSYDVSPRDISRFTSPGRTPSDHDSEPTSTERRATAKLKTKPARGRPLTAAGYRKLLKQAHRKYLADVKAGRCKPITLADLAAVRRTPAANSSNLKAFRKACRKADSERWPELRDYRLPEDEIW